MNGDRASPSADGPAAPPPPPGAARSPLRALANRNFRLFFGGQTVSLIGTWMQQAAMTWLVYQLSDSSFLLGLVGFAGQLPTFFLAPVAGVWADHWNRHRLLLTTQTLAMLQAFVMAGLAHTGMLTVGPILVLSLFLGIVNAFDMTVRQAFMTEMLERKEDLANAIALNSSMVNGTRLIGPSLAGAVLGWVGAATCFLLNGLSYLAVLAALAAMRIAPRRLPHGRPRVWRGLREGFEYAFGFAPIRAILLLLGLTSVAGMSYAVLMPVFARDVLHGGPMTYGLLMAAAGAGALAAAVYLAARRSILGLGLRIALAPALLGLGLIAFSYSDILWVSLALLAVVGFAVMVQMAASNTILQTIVPEDKRGRVMSFYAVAFLGLAPIGSLLTGALAGPGALGPQGTLRAGGLCCVVGSLIFLTQLGRIRELIRPIYREIGVLPPVAAGIQTASEITVPPED